MITTVVRWSSGLAIVVSSLAGTALGQNGRLLDATPVTLDEDALKRLETSRPGIRSLQGQVDVKAITYLSDGLKVKGYLAVPKHGEKLPCLIFNRGGSLEFGALTDAQAVMRLGNMAAWGYVVAASQYRGNGGGEGHEEFGGADVDDVLNLIPLFASVSRADTTRIGMYGWSRGGMMTYLALTRTDRVAAAIVGSGMADAFDTIKRRPEMETNVLAQLIPNYQKNKEAALTARSAVRWADKLCKQTPLLILHGSADWRVHPSEALAMTSALYECNHPFRFVFFEGGQHSLMEHRPEVDRLARDWLDHYVRDRTPWPSLEPHGE